MEKEKFLKELEYLLMDLSEEERQEALQYYRDYFADAGLEHEQQVLGELGSPERIAAELKGSLNGQENGGEFSERGYRAEWYEEDECVPDQYTEHYEREDKTDDSMLKKEIVRRRRNGFLFLILFLIFGLPLAGTILSAGASIILAFLAALFGGITGLFGLLIGAAVLVAAIFVAGVALIIAGCIGISVLPVGLMCIGGGFLILAAAFLLTILVKWGFCIVLPGFVGFFADLVRCICRWLRKTVCNVRNKGGAA